MRAFLVATSGKSHNQLRHTVKLHVFEEKPIACDFYRTEADTTKQVFIYIRNRKEPN